MATGTGAGTWSVGCALAIALLLTGSVAIDEVRMFVELVDRQGIPSFEHRALAEVRLAFHVVEQESLWTLRCELETPLNTTHPLCPGAFAEPPVCDEQPPTPPGGVSVLLRLDRSLGPWVPGLYRLLCTPNEVGSFSQRMTVVFNVREGGATPSPSPAAPAPSARSALITPVPPRLTVAPPGPSPVAAASTAPEPSPAPSPGGGPVCGDRTCERGEDESTCCRDCGCLLPKHACVHGSCVLVAEGATDCGPGRACPNLESVTRSIDTIIKGRLEVANELARLESEGFRVVRPYSIRPFSGYKFRIPAVKGDRQVVIEGDIDASTGIISSYRIIGGQEEAWALPGSTGVVIVAAVVFVSCYFFLVGRGMGRTGGPTASGEERSDLESMGDVGSVEQLNRASAEAEAAARADTAALHAEHPPGWSEEAGWHQHRAVARRQEEALRTLDRMGADARSLPPAAAQHAGGAPGPGQEALQPAAGSSRLPAPVPLAPPPAAVGPASDDDEKLIDSWLDDE